MELDPNTTHPVIALMPDQNGVEDIGGTLRLGSYPCVLDPTSKARELYGSEEIHERHRHRYEVNNDFQMCIRDRASVKELQGMGIQPDIIVCRSEHELDQSLKDKIALFCNVPNGNVLQNLDVEYLYEAPLAMEKENLAKVACKACLLYTSLCNGIFEET